MSDSQVWIVSVKPEVKVLNELYEIDEDHNLRFFADEFLIDGPFVHLDLCTEKLPEDLSTAPIRLTIPASSVLWATRLSRMKNFSGFGGGRS